MVPIEVCYQTNLDAKHRLTPKDFISRHAKEGDFGIIISRDSYNFSLPVIELPLPFFLLAA